MFEIIRLKVLLTTLGIFGLIFGTISHLIEELEQWELPLIEYLQEVHSPALDFFFKYVTKGGFEIFFVLIPIGCFWGNYGRIKKKDEKGKELKFQEEWPFGVNFVLILSYTWFILSVVKLVFVRPRPFHVSELINVLEDVKIVEYSYPSGHASGCSVCWLFLYFNYIDFAKRHNYRAIVAGIISCLLVGISRVYFGVHYPHDIIAGYLMGLSIALVFRKFHHGVARYYLLIVHIILGVIFFFTVSAEMLLFHPGILYTPATSLFVLLSYKFCHLLPTFSLLNYRADNVVDLKFSKRVLRLTIGIVMMFTVPFPFLPYLPGWGYLTSIPYAFFVTGWLLVVIPRTFQLLNLHKN